MLVLRIIQMQMVKFAISEMGADRKLDGAVVAGGQAELIFNVIVKDLLEGVVPHIAEAAQPQQLDPRQVEEGLAGGEGGKGVALPHQCAQLGAAGRGIGVRQAEHKEADARHQQADRLCEEGVPDPKLAQHPADKVAERGEDALPGGVDGQILAALFLRGGVGHIGQRADKDAAGEHAGQQPGDQDLGHPRARPNISCPTAYPVQEISRQTREDKMALILPQNGENRNMVVIITASARPNM